MCPRVRVEHGAAGNRIQRCQLPAHRTPVGVTETVLGCALAHWGLAMSDLAHLTSDHSRFRGDILGQGARHGGSVRQEIDRSPA